MAQVLPLYAGEEPRGGASLAAVACRTTFVISRINSGMAPKARSRKQSASGMNDVFRNAAQSRVVLAPHLKAEGNGNHDDEVDVREKGDAPDGLGLTAGPEGTQEFGENQHRESVCASRFRASCLQDIK